MKLQLLALMMSLSLPGIGSAVGAEMILNGTAQDIRALVRAFPQLEREALFSANEKKILLRTSKKDLAETLLLKNVDSTTSDALRKHIHKHSLKLSIEENSKVFTRSLAPGDALAADLWGLKNTGKDQKEFLDYFSSRVIHGVAGEDVNLPETSNQGEGVVVAVLDTGVDLTHPDLKDRIFTKTSECEAKAKYQACLKSSNRRECDKQWATVDTDGNGYPMDCQGWNMIGPKNPVSGVYGNGDVKDLISHGTHVAGIVAGAINGTGIQGIAPRSKILPVQVITDNPTGESGVIGDDESAATLTSVVARGILYAVSSKANVINLSLGWNGRADSPLVRDMVKLAHENKILVVAAAGNDGTDALVFPCQYSEVICVGAHAADGQIPRFSNFGSGVDIAAPGMNILSSIPYSIDPEVFTDMRGFDFKDGTSMAAPYVAGALAVLLSQGMSPNEARARLLAGARPRPFVESRLVLTGNLDVARALNLSPRPMIIPMEKGVIPTLWNQNQSTIPVSFSLKNIWKDAKNVQLTLRISERDARLATFGLSRQQWAIDRWKSDEEKSLEFNLNVFSPKISSELFLILEVSSEGQILQNIRIPLQVSVVIWADKKFPGAQYIPLVSGALNPNARIFTIQSLDGIAKQDYVAIEKTADAWNYQLVRETDQGYVASEIRPMPALQGDPRVLTRLDVNLDGKSDYVFTYYIEPPRPTVDPSKPSSSEPKVRVPYFRFDFLSENLDPVFESYTFKNETSVLQLEKFQWMKIKDRLVPSWVDVGKTPEVEKSTKFDPWNPNPSNPMQPRLYYHDPSTPDGMRSIATPSGKQVIGVLQSGLEQRKQGVVSVLYGDTLSYVTQFHTARINEDLGISAPVLTPVKMDAFRNLRSIEQIKIQNLNPHSAWGSSAYIGISGTNSQRITALVPEGAGYRTLDQIMNPTEIGDSVFKVISTYVNQDSGSTPFMASFAQGQYQLKYLDTRSERVFETSLRRYTFLASALFERSFYPAIAETDGVRVAAIQIPDGFGAYPGAEVVAPMLDAQGNVLDLVRPAKLRIQVADPSCEWLAKIDATAEAPAQAVYFCQNQFIRIPYRY